MRRAADVTTQQPPSSTTLYFGPWYRKSPYFEATLRHGCSAYDIYNHMYLPSYFHDPVVEYWHLLEHVTLWDVAVEHIVEITGPDAFQFTNMLISPHPDFVLSHRLEPLSPSQTRVECRTLFERGAAVAAGFDGRYASEFWDVTNRQDWAAVESIQRSAASLGFRPGPISEMEEAVYQFFNMIAASYVEGRLVHPKNPSVLSEPLR